jgi:hypothetical protein
MRTERESFIEDLRREWRAMWEERLDDRMRAESVAAKDYPELSVQKGLIIMATRDFRPLDFNDVISQYLHKQDIQIHVPPNPEVGGWGRFAREVLATQNHRRNRRATLDDIEPHNAKTRLRKKGGRGWLHQ